VKVLVVDDHVDAALALALLLEAAECAVQTAYTGASALERATAQLPHVVLLDIGLPDMTGLEVAARLRRDPRTQGALLIALTGFGHEEMIQRVKEAGFDLYLLKPVGPDVLFKLLASAQRQRT
jgi:two-component system, chemotaxis family, CheB/CheR fusion protein